MLCQPQPLEGLKVLYYEERKELSEWKVSIEEKSKMGNETSSVKIHSLLTAEDLKKLRENFPGGGASVTPVNGLDWGAWKQAWPQNRRLNLEKCLKNEGEQLTFHAYQEMAGRFVRGTTEERAKLIFKLVDNNNAQTIKVN